MENNTVVKKSRMDEQDVGKGLAMLMVILTHSVTLFTDGGRDMNVSGASHVMTSLFGFIMGFFVIMAGYNYKSRGESYGTTILKRLKQLFLPFVIISTILWILLGTYLVIKGETDVAKILESYIAFWITDPAAEWMGLDASRTFVAQALGPTWFIKSLFSASLIFLAVADYALEKTSRLISVVIMLLTITFLFCLFGITLPWLIEIAPAIAALMLLGAFMKKCDIYTGHESKTIYKWLNFFAAYIFVFALGMAVPRIGMISGGRIDLAAGPVETYITAIYCLAGTYVMLAICRPILRVPIVSDFLKWFGKNSLFVLIIHGSVMRIFCDIFGITGGDQKIRVTNILAFVLTAVVTSFIILGIEKTVYKKNIKKTYKS